mgnify:CR=1 FL=1
MKLKSEKMHDTYIFDVWAWMDGDNIAVLDPQVVANNPVYPCGPIIEIVIGKNDEDGVLPLLALDEDCVTAEELESLHSVV